MPFLCFTDRFFELRSCVRAYGEFDPAEAFIPAPVAIGHKIMLLARRIGTESYGLYPFGQKGKGVDKNTELFDRLPSGEVEEDKGHDDLLIRPALGLCVEMSRDVFSQVENGSEVEVDGEAGKGSHAACGLLFFALVGEWAL
jgi:hypothetical protein